MAQYLTNVRVWEPEGFRRVRCAQCGFEGKYHYNTGWVYIGAKRVGERTEITNVRESRVERTERGTIVIPGGKTITKTPIYEGEPHLLCPTCTQGERKRPVVAKGPGWELERGETPSFVLRVGAQSPIVRP